MQAHSLTRTRRPGPPLARAVRACRYPTWLLLLILIWPVGGLAAALKDVEFASLPGNQVRIDLVLSEAVAAPRDFSTDSPARIVLDLPGVTSELPRKNVAIDVGPVQSLTALDAEGRTRIVVNLATPVPYRVQSQGDRISIAINESAVTSPLAVPAPVAPPSAAPSTAKGPELRGIDFQRGPAGEGRVLVKLPRPDTRATVAEQGGKVVVEVLDASLPARLRRRLDVVDFGTPVVAIESQPKGRDVAITIQPTKDYEYLAYQVNELFTIEFRTLTQEQQERKRRDQITFSGDRLTLNFQDIEVRAVLQLLADFTGLNLVASDSVKGNVTLRLKNVPWDQALDIILKSKGLTMRQKGNVIMIGPTEEVMAREEQELAATQKIEELVPLRTENIQINYAKATDIAKLLASQQMQVAKVSGSLQQGDAQAEEEETQARGLLSSRGSVTADERTNTLLVQDTADKLEQVRLLVARLDVPMRQVMIESRVVIASDNFARELGVRFGANRLQVNENKGDFNEIYGGRPGTLVGENYWGTTVDDTVPLMVDLPAPNATSAINFLIGKIGSYLLQLELSAMQQEGRGEIISNPRVITSDKQKAEIEVGQQVPIVTPGTQNEPPTVKYQDATLKLTVTPHITPDNRILMALKVTKNEADEALKVDGNPYINKRAVETNVLVDNGETVVLGGVFERSRFTSKEQVPWLGNLPIVGNLFKNDARKETNNELLIFVTPRILQPELKSR
ncbi:MAG: type IV pilus secretin PilQ [Chromatiaceae bacterium]|nr:type IV pilus secretin PilQ [Chromatiaceae bacterium]